MQENEPKKKNRKYPPKLGGESTPADLQAHERLAHEDTDPVYPFDPITGDNQKPKKNKAAD